jgi:hypothetical protein
VRLTLRRPFFDGTTDLIFEPTEFMERIVALVPRPQANQLLYHGVLAANHRWRRRVVGYGRPKPDPNTGKVPVSPAGAATWRACMQRSFGIDVTACSCGGKFVLVAVIMKPAAIRRILVHLGLPADAPAITPVRGPPAELESFDSFA